MRNEIGQCPVILDQLTKTVDDLTAVTETCYSTLSETLNISKVGDCISSPALIKQSVEVRLVEVLESACNEKSVRMSPNNMLQLMLIQFPLVQLLP